MTPRSTRLSFGAALLLLGGTVASACSSPTHAKSSHTHTTTSKTLPKNLSHSSPPPTTAPPRSAPPPIQASGVEAQISGSTATVQFTSNGVKGTITPSAPSFSDSGKDFTVSLTGVTYTGGVVTTAGPPTNRVAKVVVSSSSGGVTVQISLNQAASSYHFNVGNHQVTITFS